MLHLDRIQASYWVMEFFGTKLNNIFTRLILAWWLVQAMRCKRTTSEHERPD